MKINCFLSRIRLSAVVGAWMLVATIALNAAVYVTDYGAKGDLLTLSAVNVVSNSTSITCPGANFTQTDVNKLLEVFNAGIWRGASNETLVAYITSVSSPSSITVSVAAGATANGLTGVYGTDNTPCFTNAVAHCALPQDTVVIPSGNYLLIPRAIVTANWTNWYVDAAAISLSRGGLTFMGQGNAVLWGNGGWRLDNTLKVQRDHLVNFISPMTDLLPVVFTNLTFYGGINGKTGVGDLNPMTGEGWDITHHAIFFGQRDATAIFPTNITLVNCTFHGYRGEMVIHNLPNTTTFLSVSNCVFYDGNATAFNVYFTHDFNSCLFSNVQCEEFYQMNSMIGQSSVRNCTLFNSGIAINGGVYWCPPYAISNNVFLADNANINFITTTPACNVYATGNSFRNGQGISLGILGYQGAPYYCCSSNLLFSGNYFSNCYMAFHFQGYDAVEYSNSVRSVNILSNTFNHCHYDVYANGSPGYIPSYYTNVVFQYNNDTNTDLLTAPGGFDQRGTGGRYALEANNSYLPWTYNTWVSGATNFITYARGSHATLGGWAGQIYVVDDNSARLPQNAVMVISNSLAAALPLYLNAAASGTPLTVNGGQTVTLWWTGSYWTNSVPASQDSDSGSASSGGSDSKPPPSPPANLHLVFGGS